MRHSIGRDRLEGEVIGGTIGLGMAGSWGVYGRRHRKKNGGVHSR